MGILETVCATNCIQILILLNLKAGFQISIIRLWYYAPWLPSESKGRVWIKHVNLQEVIMYESFQVDASVLKYACNTEKTA